MTRPAALWLLALLVLSGCKKAAPPPPETPTKITVAVAASMRHAFEEIAAAFESAHPGIDVEATYGASGGFYAQILQQAPFSLFLSADTEYPRQLVAGGRAVADFPYAVGRLVLWAPKSAGLDVGTRGLEALRDPRVQKVAIANPTTAPYGRAAIATLQKHGLEAEIRARLAHAENVGQAAQFVQSGAAQIGLFALSLTTVPEMKDDGDAWLVPDTDHEPLEQSGVILPGAGDPAAAEKLRDFLLGPVGRAILERHGFSPPPPTVP